jgi:hypothetical protein
MQDGEEWDSDSFPVPETLLELSPLGLNRRFGIRFGFRAFSTKGAQGQGLSSRGGIFRKVSRFQVSGNVQIDRSGSIDQGLLSLGREALEFSFVIH